MNKQTFNEMMDSFKMGLYHILEDTNLIDYTVDVYYDGDVILVMQDDDEIGQLVVSCDDFADYDYDKFIKVMGQIRYYNMIEKGDY